MEQENQMGNTYLIQSSTGSIPASHSPIPATFWTVASPSSSQMMVGSDNMWPFSSMSGSTIPSGVHFMNFPTPIALLPGQQTTHNNSVGGDSHLGMLAALNAYRPVPTGTGNISGSDQASGSHHQHHGGGGEEGA